MKKTKTLFASLALVGAMAFAWATASALNAPQAAAPGEKVGQITDVIKASDFAVAKADWKYADYTNVKLNSDALYTLQCGVPQVAGQDIFLLRDANMNSGILTSFTGGDVVKVVVDFADANVVPGVIDADNSLLVYGSHTPYAACTDLFYPTTCGTLVGDLNPANNELAITGEYEYIGIRAAHGTVAIAGIALTLEGPQYYVEAPAFDPEGAVINVGCDVTLSCATPNAKIYYQIGDGEVQVYNEGDVITPMEECTITAWATTYNDLCVSEKVSQSYEYAVVDNLNAAADMPEGIPFVYEGELVVVSNYNEGGLYLVYDGYRYYGLGSGDDEFYKGDIIGDKWLAQNTPYGITTWDAEVDGYELMWLYKKVENLPVAPAYAIEDLASCKFDWNYCTIEGIEFDEDAPDFDSAVTVEAGDQEITIANLVEIYPVPAGKYNVTGFWYSFPPVNMQEGQTTVFIPTAYEAVNEQFDIDFLIGNYKINWFQNDDEYPMFFTDSWEWKQVEIREGEGVNEVTIRGLLPDFDFTVTGVVNLPDYTITIPAQDVMIGDQKMRLCNAEAMEYQRLNCYEPIVISLWNDEINMSTGYALAAYDNSLTTWMPMANVRFEWLSKVKIDDLYLFGEMNAWGTDDEINQAWKFKSYDNADFTLVVPAEIPADKMFIITDGVYDGEHIVNSWGGVTGMDLNTPYELYLQNPYYVSHCNLAETFPKGGTVRFSPYNLTVVFDATTSIETLDSAINSDAVYYNLNGMQVEKPAQGNIYIRVLDGKATKVIVK